MVTSRSVRRRRTLWRFGLQQHFQRFARGSERECAGDVRRSAKARAAIQ